MQIKNRLGRTVSTIAAAAAFVATSVFTAGQAHAITNTPVEYPAFVPQDANYQANLQKEVNYFTLPKIAYAINPQPAAGPTSGGDDISAAWPKGKGLVSRTSGLLLFHNRDVRDTAHPDDPKHLSACTGTVVNSPNQSLVTTSGHCIEQFFDAGIFGGDLSVHEYATSGVFIPGADLSKLDQSITDLYTTTGALPGPDVAPYGVWGLTRQWVTSRWDAAPNNVGFLGNGNDDVAMLTVAKPGESRPIAQVVGAQQIGFNQPQGQTEYVFGYPRGDSAPGIPGDDQWYYPPNGVYPGTSNNSHGVPPSLQRIFDGRRLIVGHGTSRPDNAKPNNDMIYVATAHGSSGGPFFQNFDPNTGAGTMVGTMSHANNTATPFDYTVGPWAEGAHFKDMEKAMYDVASVAKQ